MLNLGNVPVRIVGRYALCQEIALGGMATVHLGRLLASAGFARTVAIKRMHAHLAKDSELAAMFIDEARVASRLRHPNVAAPVDVVAVENEVLLVMEYVHGESLSRLLSTAVKRGEQVPVEIIAPIMAGVLHGLHSAHEALDEEGRPLGIVHRDVSPQNVIVGADGVARVVDFGIAKAVGRLQRTQPGELKGKLGYMSPEQVRGEPVDRRTDIYACGVVLWEALTGRQMFAGESDAAILSKILVEWIPPPSTHGPGISSALDDVIHRCVDRDASARFATARDVAGALDHAVRFASASAIGEWVEGLAGPALHERAATVAAIERASADLRSPAEVLEHDETLRADAVSSYVDASPSSVSEVATTRVMRPRGGGSPPPALARSWKYARHGAFAALGAAVIGLLWVDLARRGSQPDPVTTIAPAGIQATEDPAGTPAAAAGREAPEGEPAALPPSPVASAAAAPGSANPRTPNAVTTSTARPRVPATACNPPYTFDSSGTKRYKLGCL